MGCTYICYCVTSRLAVCAPVLYRSVVVQIGEYRQLGAWVDWTDVRAKFPGYFQVVKSYLVEDGIVFSTLPMPWLIITLRHKEPGPRFNINMPSYQYRKSICGDKAVVRSSYLHNGISYAGKMTSLYWIRALDINGHGIDIFLTEYSSLDTRNVSFKVCDFQYVSNCVLRTPLIVHCINRARLLTDQCW